MQIDDSAWNQHEVIDREFYSLHQITVNEINFIGRQEHVAIRRAQESEE